MLDPNIQYYIYFTFLSYHFQVLLSLVPINILITENTISHFELVIAYRYLHEQF